MPQQVPRLLAVFTLLAVTFVVARRQLVPETFGELGHYRAAAIDDVTARTLKYAGHEACASCHEAKARRRLASNHRGVRCEVCHGPGARHVADSGRVELPAPRKRSLCPVCHEYNPSRPTGFPQILPETHNPGEPCITCHDPHAPEPPRTPEECSACHRMIENQKAVSHHASLRCTTCHETPAQHKNDPRRVHPGSPDRNGFCALCHSGNFPRAPQIDTERHNPQNNCWDCHYPHHPEAE